METLGREKWLCGLVFHVSQYAVLIGDVTLQGDICHCLGGRLVRKELQITKDTRLICEKR